MSLILVVDDAAAVREPIAAALRLAGYRTATAVDGKQALVAVLKEKPDLILLDLAMPVMDGMEYLAALRALPWTASTPVIVLSAGADRELVSRAAKFQVKDYLLKSALSLPELLKRVKQHVSDLVAAAAPDAPGAAVSADPVAPAAPSVGPIYRLAPDSFGRASEADGYKS